MYHSGKANTQGRQQQGNECDASLELTLSRMLKMY